MAPMLPSDKLRPCLLDRLTDHAPHRRKEGRDERVMSMRQYREAVLRDLRWLLNCSNRESDDDITSFEEVDRSVINYGIPDLTGVPASSIKVGAVAQRIVRAIKLCEPRILPNTLRVIPQADADSFTGNALSFRIEGELWAQPFNEKLLLKTDVDLETGEFDVSEG